MKQLVFVVLSLLLAGAACAQGSASPSPMPALPAPAKEHEWLKKLEGEWDVESEMIMGPGQPPMKGKGRESAKLYGGFFLVADGEMEVAPGQAMKSRLTLGYDPGKKHYTGSFISSCDSTMWVYTGQVDAAGKLLALDTEGPNVMTPGKDAKYKETIELVDADRRVFTSSIQMPDGKWVRFMTSQYTRRK